MHWNGLLITFVGLLPALYGAYCLVSPSERERCRNAAYFRPRLMASIPFNLGFVLFMLLGLFMIVDGVFYVFAGHSLPPFQQPS